MVILPAFESHVTAGPRRRVSLLAGALIALAIGPAPDPISQTRAFAQTEQPAPCLQVSQISELARSLNSTTGAGDSYDAAARLAFGSAPDSQVLTAFEENRSFVYASGYAGAGLARRLVILKPSTFVVDDRARSRSQPAPCLYSGSPPEIFTGGVRVAEGESELFWEVLQPQKVAYKVSHLTPGIPGPAAYRVEASAMSTTAEFIYRCSVIEKQHPMPPAHATLTPDVDPWELTVAGADRVFRLRLGSGSGDTGEIEVSTAGGKTLVERQPFPSGILPHGPEGNRLLETWDADYRGQQPPAWDIGHPADELQKVVKGGTVTKCRAVDLCCGSGTDAIFLASQGFDVTAIDVAPTAIARARQKAARAGVKIHWLLADVLKPPGQEPFDFIYDRGCYHVVRDQNLSAYLETVRRISHPGSQFLLLSARRNGQEANSPGVTEEELRYDFREFFSVEWLRQIQLESNQPGVNPPGWSALMRRNAAP